LNSKTYSMRILVFGAGAIGTFIGGNLAIYGNKVVFIEQPDVASELQGRGLRIEEGQNKLHISNVAIAGSLAEGLAKGPFDVAIFALKGYDTQGAISGINPFLNLLPPFFCLQNGVENELALAKVLGAERVIPGTLTSSVARNSAGDIIVEKRRGVGVAAGFPLSDILVTMFNNAKLNARIYPRGQDMKWSKMMVNLLGNSTAAILDMPPDQIFANPHLFRLEVAQLQEAMQVMNVQGIRAVNLPGVPVSLLVKGVRILPQVLYRPLLIWSVSGGRGGKMPSFHIDLHSGRGFSEVDYLNGAVVRFGERFNVPTPVNRFLNDTLMGLTSGVIPFNVYTHNPGKLLAALNR
jgi:2-dehydropantoate 2-reductase